MSFFGFHPLIERWFLDRFEAPTKPQSLGWPHIAAGENTLIAAPTGSGKTLTAFLAVIDRLLKESIEGQLEEEGMRVVYVSPLRALSNDMHRNLSVPLEELNALAADEFSGVPIAQLRAGLRTGDTTSSQRAALVRKPPHILVTTPESLFLLLTAERGREALKTVDTVIVDEIHALVRDKRGSHLALSLERLEEHVGTPLQRIGLSATQKPIERVADFLTGGRIESPLTPEGANLRAAVPVRSCRIVDVGHSRALDLEIVIPPSELSAVCSNEQWAEVSDQLVELINSHRSTLIFVNTRRLAERVTHWLSGILGEEAVGSHHGSIASDRRLDTECRLKTGQLKAVVATASLELGLDVGFIDLVIQIGSPRSIATFLQRIGRSGHSLGKTPKGRLLALTRDELIECMSLIRAVRAGRLDDIPIPENPVDVLAQQIVAEVACREWDTDELFEVCCRAWPFRKLERKDFNETLHFLSEGLTDRAGRARVYIHHDMVQKRVRSRPGARIVAASNAGAIPEVGLFRVVTEDGTVVGTLDEDFAIESHSGQIFLLGNTSWRIQHVRGMDVTVTDAGGAPPTIPFWRGEAPGRTLELSEEISKLREQLEEKIKAVPETVVATWWDEAESKSVNTAPATEGEGKAAAGQREANLDAICQWLVTETSCSEFAAQQTVLYIASQIAAVGLVPTQKRVIFERFFDETGGMQLVVHAPFGSRITHAWGLAMRKRFCRSFDFELQATADDNGFILSLGPQHSFPLESMFSMLDPNNVRGCVEQALLYIPMFQIRWRWNANRALLVPRRDKGKKVPPNLQRFRADDLLTSVFPLLTGCQENVVGELELPDHVLVQQTMHDCLTEALDIEGLEEVLGWLDQGEMEFIARDTREPSPFSYQLLNSNPYSFLDGGEIAERRARAVSTRRSLSVESVNDLGRLDPLGIEQVVGEASPLIRNADELHDVLLTRIVVPVEELAEFESLFKELALVRRAARLTVTGDASFEAVVAAERLPAARTMFPDAMLSPVIEAPEGVRTAWNNVDARIATIRGLMEVSGPQTAEEVARRTGTTDRQAFASLEALEGEGIVLRGKFRESRKVEGDLRETSSSSVEWCHRRLLARIHRVTMDGLRRQIQPVKPDVFLRFLTEHHGLAKNSQRAGSDGLFEVISILQGIDLAASSWEESILPGRVRGYKPEWLDELCLTGEVGWGRLFPPRKDREAPASLSKIVPVSIFLRGDAEWLTALADPSPGLWPSPPLQGGEGTEAAGEEESQPISDAARRVAETFTGRGAMFATDLMAECGLARGELNQALGELIALGVVTADGFGGLRDLSGGRKAARSGAVLKPGLVRQRHSAGGTGRWTLTELGSRAVPSPAKGERTENDIVEQWAWQLLRRWGVVFRDLLIRESGAPRWWELLQVYRRLEARGEIRGGRFISGVAGEQFGLGEIVRKLRQLRDEATQPVTKTRSLRHSFLETMRSGEVSDVDLTPVEERSRASESSSQTRTVALPGGVVQEPVSPGASVFEPTQQRDTTPESISRKPDLLLLSAADPLNLIGIITDHDRVPSLAHNRIVLFDGKPVAAIQNGKLRILGDLPQAQLRDLQRLLGSDVTLDEAMWRAAGQNLDKDEVTLSHDDGKQPKEEVTEEPRSRRRFRPVIS